MLGFGILICVAAFQYETSTTDIGVKPSEIPGLSSEVGWVHHDLPSLMWRQLMGLMTGLAIGFSGFVAILTGSVLSAIHKIGEDDDANE